MKLLFHAHTTFSHDGKLSPQELAQLAAAKGFSAVFLSEHFEDLDAESYQRIVEACEQVDSTCMLVPGYERDWNGYHIIAFGVSVWLDDLDMTTWADQVREAGGLVCMAHTSRYNHRIPEAILQVCDVVEVWNSKRPYDGLLGPEPKAYALLGARRQPLAGQDVHKKRDLNRLAVEIESVFTIADMLAAVKDGAYVLTSPLMTLDGYPSGIKRLLLRLWHPVRRVAWSIPVGSYHFLRRAMRKLKAQQFAR